MDVGAPSLVRPLIYGAAAVLVAALLLWRWVALPSESPIKNDALDNLRMAYNFSVNDTLSLGVSNDGSERDLIPTYYREPLPPIVLGVYFKALQLFRGPVSFDFLREGRGARLAKLYNVYWSTILCLSIFAALRVLTRSSILAIAGTLIVGVNADVDTLLTELPAAALLALAAFLTMTAIGARLPLWYGLAGLSFGALILTKGAFLYITLALVACLALWSIFRWHHDVQHKALGPVLFVLGILLVVGPWMARNYYSLGNLVVTDRGGLALMTRALEDQMSATEYLGSFYVWARPGWIKRTVGEVLGFGDEDLNKGGRLQHLYDFGSAEFGADDYAAEQAGMPEAAISYYRRARAEGQRIERELAEQAILFPKSALMGNYENVGWI